MSCALLASFSSCTSISSTDCSRDMRSSFSRMSLTIVFSTRAVLHDERTVSRAEFSSALRNMQQARAWLRYCPTCEFRNDCAYCHECNTDCTKCTESVFCASCWADHPARNAMAADDEDGDDEEGGQKKGSVHEFGSTEYFRTHLVLKPLDWAYNSPALAGLPVAYKAKLRQLLREQQMKQAEATEQALAMRADDAERNR